MIRLDKYLADTGAASRREAKAYIRRGEVTVDGVPARAPEQKIAETAVVCLRGQVLRYQAYHYYMLHKPAGVLTATADRSQPTVLDLFPPELRRFGLVPAGGSTRTRPACCSLRTTGTMSTVSSRRKSTCRRSTSRARMDSPRARMWTVLHRALSSATGRSACPPGWSCCRSRGAAASRSMKGNIIWSSGCWLAAGRPFCSCTGCRSGR